MLDFSDVRKLLLELAQCHTVDAVLKHAVTALAQASHIALVRIWLIEPGDRCSSCKDSRLCMDKKHCLHLRASNGRSVISDKVWDSIEGSSFSRFPIGIRKVGEIAASGKPIEVVHIVGNETWVANPAWMRAEGIVSFAGQPLVCRETVLGVLSIFSRCMLEKDILEMLRMIADHMAYAIANAKAFELVDELKHQIEAENALLREEIKEVQVFKGIIGISESIDKIREIIRMVGPTDANVLIYGESGTGKEMIARELHKQSARRDSPMLKINCSAIPSELFESEFFGHAKGAFTGALKSRIGYFQTADGGTLFLDEVGELPVYLQSKLLRVLQEGEYQRIGEDAVQKVDVRIISATNKNLKAEIQGGTFREDLYYRLQVFPVEVPALRDRKEDIPLLTRHLLALLCKKMNRPPIHLNERQMLTLCQYYWPGNIRELQNIIERIAITGRVDPVLAELGYNPAQASTGKASLPPLPAIHQVLTEKEIRELEKSNMLSAIKQTNWRIYGPRGAARLLGINPTTLISRLKKIGLYQNGAEKDE